MFCVLSKYLSNISIENFIVISLLQSVASTWTTIGDITHAWLVLFLLLC